MWQKILFIKFKLYLVVIMKIQHDRKNRSTILSFNRTILYKKFKYFKNSIYKNTRESEKNFSASSNFFIFTKIAA